LSEQQKRHVEIYEVSMQRHIHIHKNLHSPMLAMWRKKNIAQETDAPAAPKHQTEPHPQTDLWQFKILHIPKRKKNTNNEKKYYQVSKQLVTTSTTNQQPK
jgi:hypothetical protein